jgi:hypothetical protein
MITKGKSEGIKRKAQVKCDVKSSLFQDKSKFCYAIPS